MADYDQRQQARILEGIATGEILERVIAKVKFDMRPEYFQILKECGDLPVYPVRLP